MDDASCLHADAASSVEVIRCDIVLIRKLNQVKHGDKKGHHLKSCLANYTIQSKNMKTKRISQGCKDEKG